MARKSILLSLCCLILWNLPAQRNKIDSLERLLKQTQDDSLRSYRCLELVALYYTFNQDTALVYAERALEYALQAGSERMELASYANIAAVKSQYGDWEGAIDIYYQALERTIALNLYSGTARILTNLSIMYMYRDQYDKAADMLHEAVPASIASGDTSQLANTYINLCKLHFDQLQNDSSIFYAQAAYDLYLAIGDREGEATSLGNLAANYIDLGQYQKAIETNEKAIKINLEIEDYFSLSNAYSNQGEAYSEIGNYPRATEMVHEGLRYANALGSLVHLEGCYEKLMEIQERAGQLDSALFYTRLFYETKDSLTRELNEEKILEVETEFETQEARAKVVEQELVISRQRNQQKNILLGGGVFLLLLFGLFQFFRYRQNLRRKEAELALQLERSEAEKLRELDRLKSNFFANISHEFRTPLTLILSPLEQFLQGSLRGNQQKYFRIMQRNGQRLLQLVNQLLDLSKLEGGRMQLSVRQGDLVTFVRAIAYSFESLAIRQEVDLEVEVSESLPLAWFDPDKLEKILTNLISNAFKFTTEGGKVKVVLKSLEKGVAELRVEDNGIGISSQQLPFIFDRFYSQQSQENEMGSTGIGLALTKELVNLHRGEIFVESQENRGAVFSFSFPIAENAYEVSEKEFTSQLVMAPASVTPHLDTTTKPSKDSSPPIMIREQKHLVLVVEDNPDVRFYIREQLEGHFELKEAGQGMMGLDIALETIPDLIITDLMMPEMDGMQLCQRLKMDERTSHIPVIMLTAKADREDKLEGLEIGADDYLVKPFDVQELRIRVDNLIRQRKKLRERFRQEGGFFPEEVAVTSVDQAFLKRVIEAVEEGMEEETFSVVELGQEVGMSRSQLHRKLKALTGKSPNEIIRQMRLQRAKKLLEKNAGNASEVAFMVGFSSLAYFSKCFKDEFGASPSKFV